MINKTSTHMTLLAAILALAIPSFLTKPAMAASLLPFNPCLVCGLPRPIFPIFPLPVGNQPVSTTPNAPINSILPPGTPNANGTNLTSNNASRSLESSLNALAPAGPGSPENPITVVRVLRSDLVGLVATDEGHEALSAQYDSDHSIKISQTHTSPTQADAVVVDLANNQDMVLQQNSDGQFVSSVDLTATDMDALRASGVMPDSKQVSAQDPHHKTAS